jgi:hypothetical protein
MAETLRGVYTERSECAQGDINKKLLIHIRDEEFSPRYHPNYVFRLKRSSVSTPEPLNVTLVAITG